MARGPCDSLDALCDIESTIESGVIALGVSNNEFALLLHQEIWSAGIVAQLEGADDERLVAQELIATLGVLPKVAYGNRTQRHH